VEEVARTIGIKIDTSQDIKPARYLLSPGWDEEWPADVKWQEMEIQIIYLKRRTEKVNVEGNTYKKKTILRRLIKQIRNHVVNLFLKEDERYEGTDEEVKRSHRDSLKDLE